MEQRPTPLFDSALALLQSLIATPSLSGKENKTAGLIADFLMERGIAVQWRGNNVWASHPQWDKSKPVLLLNSHHDTVKPSAGWQRDPFLPSIADGKLYGLGSNDAGGPLVGLIAAFLHFCEIGAALPFNLLLAATAEEEISGPNGIAAVLSEWPPISLGIIGEPTQMQLAIAERGLMVIDAEVSGIAGHAARDEGVNAIYLALQDIAWIRQHQFERVSRLLGPVKTTVTQIQAGSQHNVVPDRCRFVIDVRTNEHYTNAEILEWLQIHTQSILVPRSTRLNPSGLPEDHPMVQAALSLGLRTFGSPTLSDQALCPFPTVKIGPGDSARSHTADEYIELVELEAGIAGYIQLIDAYAAKLTTA